MLRHRILMTAALLALAGAAPAAHAQSAHSEGLDLRVTSVAFQDPTPKCPVFRVRLGLSSDAGAGTATACVQADDFCRTVLGTWTLRLQEGTLRALVIQRETCTFDPASGDLTSASIRLDGTVSKASGALAGLAGGLLSGGGTTTFGPDGTATPDMTLHLDAGSGAATAFEGSDTGTFTGVPTDDPNVVLAPAQAAGQASHLGRYRFIASEIDDLSTGEVYGTFILTTRNGAIFGTYTGFTAPTDSPTAVTYLVGGTITGGRGRYAGATGTIAFDGGGDFATGQLFDRLSGVVVTPGAGATP
jgi:hypothetical protein